MAADKRMRFLILQIFWTGISIAYYSGILVDVMSDSIHPYPGETPSSLKED